MKPAPPPPLESLLADTSWLRVLAGGLVGNQDADDLLQDAWVRTLEAGATRTRSPRAWMRTVLANLARDRHRGAGNRSKRERAAARPEAQPSSEQLTQRVELFEKLARAVRSLDEPYRTAITLRYMEECAVKEIARRLELPERTVETRLRRGLVQLKAKLDALHGGQREQWFGVAAVVAVAGGDMAVRTNGLGLAALLLLVVGGGSYAAWRWIDAPPQENAEHALLLEPERPVARPEPVVSAGATRSAQRAPASTRVQLLVTSAAHPVAGIGAQGLPDTHVTDEEGRARFEWDPAWGKTRRITYAATPTTCEHEVLLRGPGAYSVELPLRSGRIEGWVLDEDRRPVKTEVLAFRTKKLAGVRLDRPDARVETGSNGSFVFEGMAGERPGRAGEFALLVANERWATIVGVAGTVEQDQTAILSLVVARARTIPMRVIDPRKRALPDAEVVVTYTSEQGEELLDAARAHRDGLALFGIDEKTKGLRWSQRLGYTLGLDATGACEVFAPREEAVDLAARHELYRTWKGSRERKNEKLVTARLGPGARVAGRVLANGRALSGALVALHSADAKANQSTDADGRFEFEGVTLDDGALVAIGAASATGFASHVEEIRPEAGARVDLKVELVGARSLTGVVLDKRLAPRATWVHFRREKTFGIPWAMKLASSTRLATAELFTAPNAGRVHTRDDGTFRIDGLEPGELLLWTESPEGSADSALWARAGTGTLIELRQGRGLEEKANLDLELLDMETGANLGPGSYRLIPVAVDPFGDVHRGQPEQGGFTGRLQLPGREPGTYVLEASSGGQTYRSELLELPRGWTTLPFPLRRVDPAETAGAGR